MSSPEWGTKKRAEEVQQRLAADYDRLEALYKHLHANPELSLHEARTADRLARELKEIGFEVTEKVGGNGIVGVFKNGDGPTVMVRTDMDALPVTSRPSPMPVLAENIPASLRPLRRWVCWRWVWDDKARGGRGKWNKLLYDPRTGRHASSTDPGTWTDLNAALGAHRSGQYDGIGITLG